jgi:hypothetical protein
VRDTIAVNRTDRDRGPDSRGRRRRLTAGVPRANHYDVNGFAMHLSCSADQ